MLFHRKRPQNSHACGEIAETKNVPVVRKIKKTRKEGLIAFRIVEEAAGGKNGDDCQSDVSRRENAQNAAQVKMFQADRAASLGFAAEQRGDEVSTQKEEDGDAEAAGQVAVGHGVRDEDDEKSDGAYTVEAGNVDGTISHASSERWAVLKRGSSARFAGLRKWVVRFESARGTSGRRRPRHMEAAGSHPP